jgi:hypothetical protein
VTIRTYFSWFYGISGLGSRSMPPWTSTMLSDEIAVQFFNLRHQIGIEPSDLHSGSSKPKLAATAYPIIWIESSDNDSLDSPFDDSVGTGNFRMISGGTRLQRRK